MDKEKKLKVSVKGTGFCGLLTIAFIVLKLIGQISWSWVWVLAPIWIPVVGWIVIFILITVLLSR